MPATRRPLLIVSVVLALGARPAAAAPEGADLGARLPAWSGLPFLGILLSIALLPLVAPGVWRRHHGKVAALWALALVVPFVAAYGRPALHEVLRTAVLDYAPFLVLIGTLFTVGGGILVRGTLRGSPPVNTAILAVGTLLASLIGTTGAAVLLIRPILRANRERRHVAHTVVFFTFLVANIGGALTPLGDPPLFLGFLHGVPFFWTLSMWREVLLTAALTLVAYVAVEAFYWRREDRLPRASATVPREPLRIEGWHNFVFLAGVLGVVVVSGLWHAGPVSVLGVRQEAQNLLRDGFLVLTAGASWATTPARTRQENEFSWGPIREVAILFAGIFATIIPLLLMLRAGANGALAPVVDAVRTPAGFFWVTGGVSSVLDNAPAYLTFLATALGRLVPGAGEREAVVRLIAEHGAYLRAVATGAVFMGANTYIGNAPNLMVKSIAEEAGVKMPSFLGYVLRYTVPVLVPIFLLVTWVFFF